MYGQPFYAQRPYGFFARIVAAASSLIYTTRVNILMKASSIMAIVVQPPFYAPRPPDEPIWTGKPMASKLIAGLLTATTVYGAPGQAPTKQWRSDYAEAAGWQGAPRANPLLTNATPAVTFYGAPGQAPTKLWRYDYVE